MLLGAFIADIKYRRIRLDGRWICSSRKELVKETEGYAEGEAVPKLSDRIGGLTKRT
jgi:hypothetical protein